MSEHILIAALPEPVEIGQKFEELPLHKTILGWLALRDIDADKAMLGQELHCLFDQQALYQDVRTKGRDKFGVQKDIPVTGIDMDSIDLSPRWRLRYVAGQRKLFRPGEPFKDSYKPHISDLSDGTRAAAWSIYSFETIAVFSKDPDDPDHIQTVDMTYPLKKLHD